MDYAALLAALPQETVDALANNPLGISTSQVEVTARPSQSTGVTRAVWLLPPAYERHDACLGGVITSYSFVLVIIKSDATSAQLQNIADQLRAHFDGRNVPASITDMIGSSVRDIMVRTADDDGDPELAMEITFTGIARPGST